MITNEHVELLNKLKTFVKYPRIELYGDHSGNIRYGLAGGTELFHFHDETDLSAKLQHLVDNYQTITVVITHHMPQDDIINTIKDNLPGCILNVKQS